MHAATPMGKGHPEPQPGDITMCFSCSFLMAFNDDLTLRHLTASEAMPVLSDPRVVAAKAAILAINLREESA